MASQNIITTQVPSVLSVGTKTFNFKITSVANNGGWGRLDNNVVGLIAKNTSAESSVVNTLALSPLMADNMTTAHFRDFWQKNPFYVRRLNISCSNASYLPTNIKIITPNIFTGQLDQQNIEIAANITANQFQNSIVTLDTAIVVGRSSFIEIEGAGEIPAGNWLNMYMTISVFASLEEGLYSFISNDNTIE